MTREEVKEIVRETVKEMTAQRMIEEPKKTAERKAEKEIKHFFEAEKYGGKSEDLDKVERAIKSLEKDEYIDVIYMRYRDGHTAEQIAEKMCKDVSTIRRNNKRLLKDIYIKLEKRG